MTELRPDHESPATVKRRQQNRALLIAVWCLLASALLFAALPLPLPRPLRLAVVGADVIAAAVVWLAWRQRTQPPAP
jgi:hypothetical protein